MKNWKKEFDKKYGSFKLCEIVNIKDYNRLKNFIQNLLDKQKEETVMDILKELPKMDYLKWQLRTDLSKARPSVSVKIATIQAGGWNVCINYIKNLLNKKLNK